MKRLLIALMLLWPAFSFAVVDSDDGQVYSENDVAAPAYLTRVDESQWLGSSITRIADDAGNAVNSSTWDCKKKHHYFKDQPWNNDSTVVVLTDAYNAGKAIFLNGATYAVTTGTDPAGDWRWSPDLAQPNNVVNVPSGGATLRIFNPITNSTVKTWTFTGSFTATQIGQGEGNVSSDGGKVFVCQDASTNVVCTGSGTPIACCSGVNAGTCAGYGMVVDLTATPPAGIGTLFDLTWAGHVVDHCSISPSGNYMEVLYDGLYPRIWNVSGTTVGAVVDYTGSNSAQCGTSTPSIGELSQLAHEDMLYNPFDSDAEYVVGVNRCLYGTSASTVQGTETLGRVIGIRLSDGAITNLLTYSIGGVFVSDTQSVSARATSRPGWVYVGSRNYNADTGKRFWDQVYAVKLRGSTSPDMQTEHWAFQHGTFNASSPTTFCTPPSTCTAACSCVTGTPLCYDREPHPVPSRDGRRVLFTSDWRFKLSGSQADDGPKVYVVNRSARPGCMVN